MEYNVGQFWTLINQRQNLVYDRNISYTSETVRSIDNILSLLAKKTDGAMILDYLLLEDDQNQTRVETMNRWIRFYQTPRIVREILEGLNQVLGYQGKTITL